MKIFSFMEAFKIVIPDDAYRNNVVKDMNTESLENQYEIKKIIWSAFWDLFNSQVALKMQEKIKIENTIAPGDALKLSRQAMWAEFQDILTGKKQEVDEMKEIRSRLQELINVTKTISQ